jgi:hypothetical protein
VSGDFNRDGNLDLAIVTDGISVLLGNGDGTFRKAGNYVQHGVGDSIVGADFNGDGILDLAVPVLAANNVEVLLGNGDGTFQAPIVSSTSGFASALAIGDFNHDHKLDLAMVDYPYISILLGNGDGTFQAPFDNSSFVGAHELAVGDFNNDHKLDILVGGYNGGISDLGILLGAGDGTLQNSITYPLSYAPGTVATADFNGDGNLDLVLTPNFGGDLAVLMGNGDATFQPPVYYPSFIGGPIQIGDFDGDGKLDIALAAGPIAGIDVFLGNGDGTFQPARFSATGAGGGPLKGDFNQDGKLDVVLTNPLRGVITVLNTGVVKFSPSTPLMFPVQLINTISPTQTVTLTNTGSAPLSISSINVAGDFRASDNCGSSIAAGASCSINVTFEPKTAGTLQGTITLVGGASSKPQVILLRGFSTPLTLLPARLIFGSQKVGTKSPTQQVTVTNQSNVSVTFDYIYVGGKDRTDFPIESETCSLGLGPAASCTINITFSPTKTGSRRASVYVTIVGAPYPTPVALGGVGI